MAKMPLQCLWVRKVLDERGRRGPWVLKASTDNIDTIERELWRYRRAGDLIVLPEGTDPNKRK